MPRFDAIVPAAACTALLLGLGGCASSVATGEKLFSLVTPYRIDVVQGNVVTKEQIARVKPGMSKVQVRDVLGSPLVKDIFHADRWDYLFTFRRPGIDEQRRSIVLRFDGDVLKSVDAPELPSEREFVASISRFGSSAPARDLELTEEQRKALPLPRRPEPAAAEAPLPARSYPPLEP